MHVKLKGLEFHVQIGGMMMTKTYALFFSSCAWKASPAKSESINYWLRPFLETYKAPLGDNVLNSVVMLIIMGTKRTTADDNTE